MVDLVDIIDFKQCEVLNATGSSSVGNAAKQGLRDQEALLCESDADEQLLLTINFTSKTKIHSIEVNGPDDGRAPRTVKLFANRIGLDFADAESMEAEQTLELEPEALGQRLDLRFVKFQSVDRLTVFIGDNQGETESTALSALRFWGAPLASTNMGEFKRVAGEKGEGE